MYVVARRQGERIRLLYGEVEIEVKVLSVQGKIARVGITAPDDVDIERVVECSQQEADHGPQEP